MQKEIIKKEILDSKSSIKQEQVHDLLFNREIGWQDIIHDLINTEQLDPWDIDITILSDKYLERVRSLKNTDFFISSKVLLAAALLLRIKSEILLNKHIRSIDEILFGNKEQKQTTLERIELEEDIPVLVPKSPMSRLRKVTLAELMESLNKAIKTENRKIKREIVNKNALREVGISLPKRKFSIKDKIKEIYEKLFRYFKENNNSVKISYTDFVGKNRDEKILSFFPLLQLENQKKIWLEQEIPFDEIYIWLQKIYFKEKGDPYAELKQQFKEQIKELNKEEKQRLEKINQDFPNPLGED